MLLTDYLSPTSQLHQFLTLPVLLCPVVHAWLVANYFPQFKVLESNSLFASLVTTKVNESGWANYPFSVALFETTVLP